MSIEELKEQLQINMLTTFSDSLDDKTLDTICKIVVDTFNDAFHRANAINNQRGIPYDSY